eukprot:1381537-Amorphochlora_amoeboformis.AAC.1
MSLCEACRNPYGGNSASGSGNGSGSGSGNGSGRGLIPQVKVKIERGGGKQKARGGGGGSGIAVGLEQNVVCRVGGGRVGRIVSGGRGGRGGMVAGVCGRGIGAYKDSISAHSHYSREIRAKRYYLYLTTVGLILLPISFLSVQQLCCCFLDFVILSPVMAMAIGMPRHILRAAAQELGAEAGISESTSTPSGSQAHAPNRRSPNNPSNRTPHPTAPGKANNSKHLSTHAHSQQISQSPRKPDVNVNRSTANVE